MKPDPVAFQKAVDEGATRAAGWWTVMYEGQLWESEDLQRWSPVAPEKSKHRGARRAFLAYFGAVGAAAVGLVGFVIWRLYQP